MVFMVQGCQYYAYTVYFWCLNLRLMNSTLDLDIVDEWQVRCTRQRSTVRIDRGTRAQNLSKRGIFSTGWLYLYNGIKLAKKSDQPHLSENVAHSL